MGNRLPETEEEGRALIRKLLNPSEDWQQAKRDLVHFMIRAVDGDLEKAAMVCAAAFQDFLEMHTGRKFTLAEATEANAIGLDLVEKELASRQRRRDAENEPS